MLSLFTSSVSHGLLVFVRLLSENCFPRDPNKTSDENAKLPR